MQTTSTQAAEFPTGATTWTEDWLAVVIGLLLFVLSLGVIGGADILGWVVTTSIWTDVSKALAPASKSYAQLGGIGALIATYAALLAVMTAGAAALRLDVKRFALGFTVVFALSYLCWIIGSQANLAVTTPADRTKFGIGWSARLTNEGGYVVAFIVGLFIGNFMPRLAAWMKEAIRREWYIKTAIVILGGFLAITAAEKLSLATSLMFRGLAAIIEAYLIYWAVVYYIARKFFKFSREWAAPLASGISICGVSAAIATGAAIRARPIVPIMVSSLVVIFSVFELLVLPFAARTFLSGEPMVAAAWMGLAVKTDGAAVASGAVTEALIRGQALAEAGTSYKEGWMLLTTTTVKVFIDVFIGVWAFVLALIWVHGIDKREGETVKAAEIWQRFPKFVLGYLFTFLVALAMGIFSPGSIAVLKVATAEANVFRVV